MGGGGGSSKPQYVPEPVINTPQFNPTPGGPTPVPQTFTPQGLPPWATGNFAMPWWGMSAATGRPLNQGDLQARLVAPVQPVMQQPQMQMPAYDPTDAYRTWRRGQLASGMWGERGDNNTFQDFLLDPASRFVERGMGMPGIAGVIWSMQNRSKLR